MVAAFIFTVAGIKASDSLIPQWRENENNGSRCPEGMAFIDSEERGYCIDVYESTAGADCLFREPRSQEETMANLDFEGCMPASQKDALPWTNISQNQAEIACAKAGKRLPSSREWYIASLGTPDSDSGWSPDDCQVDSNWDSQPGKSGFGSKCKSSGGAYDMIGNVWEWVSGTIADGKFNEKELPDQGFIAGVDENGIVAEISSEPEQNYFEDYFWIKKQGIRGIARGGYWENKSKAGQYAAYLVSTPSFAGQGVGFRCVKSE